LIDTVDEREDQCVSLMDWDGGLIQVPLSHRQSLVIVVTRNGMRMSALQLIPCR